VNYFYLNWDNQYEGDNAYDMIAKGEKEVGAPPN